MAEQKCLAYRSRRELKPLCVPIWKDTRGNQAIAAADSSPSLSLLAAGDCFLSTNTDFSRFR
jgi:hypothetical protein